MLEMLEDEHGLLIYLGGPLNCIGYWNISILLLLTSISHRYDCSQIRIKSGGSAKILTVIVLLKISKVWYFINVSSGSSTTQ